MAPSQPRNSPSPSKPKWRRPKTLNATRAQNIEDAFTQRGTGVPKHGRHSACSSLKHFWGGLKHVV
eukprot:7868312-Alexandrium_andersonii.AAC.1